MTAPDGRKFGGLCLDAYDLGASKLIAGRPHDLQFVAALLREGIVDHGVLVERVRQMERVEPAVKDAALRAAEVLGTSDS